MLFDLLIRPWIANNLGPHCADPGLAANVVKELDNDPALWSYFACGDLPLVPAGAAN
jgi:hypothetical protein